MILMGKIGDSDYYIMSEGALHKITGLQSYLNAEGSKAEFVGGLVKNIEYTPETYQHFYDGKDENGKQILRNSKDHKPGIDMVFTMPKGFSILYAMSDSETRKNLDKIVRKNVTRLIEEEITKLVEPSCQKGQYRKIKQEATRIASALFTHYDNREQDPHYHIHCTMFNFAEFELESGKKQKFAIDTQKIFSNNKYLSSVLDFNIRKDLNDDLGIKTTSTDNGFNVVGISREQELLLSNRSVELQKYIDEALKKKSHSSIEEIEDEFDKKQRKIYSEELRKGTAKQKEELTYKDLIATQQNKIANIGLLVGDVKQKQLLSVEEKNNKVDVFNEAVKSLVSINGYITESQLKTALYRKNINANEVFEDIEFGLDYVKNLVKIDGDKFSTVDAIEKSFKVNQFYKMLSNRNFTFCEKMNSNHSLLKEEKFYNDGQRNAVEKCCNEKRVVSIIGDAGTGKTSKVIAKANAYYLSKKINVVGLATQGKTSEALADANIRACFNIAEFFAKNPKPKNPLVLIVDEAGMVDNENYFKLLNFAEENDNVKLIFVGDNKQLSSVGYGNVFNNIVNDFKETTARVSENVRQIEAQKPIAEGFRDKDIDKAIRALAVTNGLKLAKTNDIAIQELVDSYLADSSNSKVAIAYKNDDVNKINDKIRTELINRGVVDCSSQVFIDVKTSQSVKTPRTRAFAVNEQILFTGNLKASGKQPKVKNGAVATIKAIDEKTKTITCVDSNNKEFSFNYEKFNSFNHMYCITTYKGQGVTVDSSYVYSDGNTNSNQAYVDFSRQRLSTKLFIAEENLEKFKSNAVKENIKYDLTKDETAKSIFQKIVKAEEDKELEKYKKEYEQMIRDCNNAVISRFVETKNQVEKIVVDGSTGERVMVSNIQQINANDEYLEKLNQSNIKEKIQNTQVLRPRGLRR